ncbi:hypothetical protein BS78_09G251300 [Paspalum vaginatum]|nr:hypothetical protein BS78_09G251300 [Paspalum vaginatum]
MHMQVLRLLAARQPRRAVPTTITAPAPPSEADDDEGPFFDLDFSSSVRASSSSAGSASSASGSGSDESDDAFTDLDFIISLHRSRSSSYDGALFVLQQPCCPNGSRALSTSFGSGRWYGVLARSSSSARSLRLLMESPADGDEEEKAEPRRAAPYPSPYSGDAIRRYLASISRRLRLRRARGSREATAGAGTLRRLRKSWSASAATSAARRDDSLAEKQDGIASAIAHCKESLSLHRASVSSECDSPPLPRSRSDPSSSWQGNADLQQELL